MPAAYDYSSASGYARARPDWADFPATTTPIQQTHLDRIDQALFDLKTEKFNVRDYGAAGDGTADDTAEIQAAIDAAETAGGGVVFFPAGSYKTSTPLVVDGDSITFQGVGRKESEIFNAASDVIRIGVTSGAVRFHFQVRSMKIRSATSAGGHCFAPQVGVGMCSFYDVYVLQQNAAKSLWHQVSVGPYIDIFWEHCEFEHVLSATVPGFNLKTNTADINSNTWQRSRCTNSGEFFFHLEETSGSAFITDNTFRDLTMEVTNGGNIKLLACGGTLIENVCTHDLGTTTRDLFYIGKSATLRSYRTVIRGCTRNGGTLGGGLKDIKLGADSSSAYYTTIEKCDTANVAGFTIDLVSNDYTWCKDLTDGVTIQNPSSTARFNIWPPTSINVASATTVTLPNDGDVFHITGTTTITSVTTSWRHRRVTLVFDGILTFTDGSNLKLAGNFVTTADDTITLVCDGTNWYEQSRSVN
jgi:hypothetical protein